MRNKSVSRLILNRTLAISALCMIAFVLSASAQSRRTIEGLSDKLVDISVGEVTLEAIDLRNQTARMSVGLDITNKLLPVKLKDFDYSLRLFGERAIEGTYPGTMKISGRRATRVNLPIAVNLRSIPSVVWSAFRNRGRVGYQLDAGFTVPLFITEKRFDQSFSGEVPLRSIVDAATILQAQRQGGSRITDGLFGHW